ncbi:MAG: UDP-N-acetylmuramate dehydrogenase [Acidobacteria bacterium]|nr:UDP-N-acetylmuramate dehydrogenase [Acidobacteriota bacterium]MBV9622885.1 UDP-N-acetylmuramate dehydrogenase [Acidobacteriota bacterium]
MQSTGLALQQDVPLAPLTTLGVGGCAQFLVRAEQVREVEAAVRFAESRQLPLLVLGGGSNLVVADRGWPGLVLQVALEGICHYHGQGSEVFEVGAGMNWDCFVAESVSLDCGGIECLSGIPGSVGGTPVQNVGAYGQEISQTVASVLAFDRRDNCVKPLKAAECGFAYRQSIFNSSQMGRYIILRVTYELFPAARPDLRYVDLERYFAGGERRPTLLDVRMAIREIRAAKGMLITAGDPDSRSAGSFFKNPILAEAQYVELERRAAESNLQVPNYPALARQKKVSAAWLVENSGFTKGYRRGRASISTKHALAIVNRGGATAAEILALRDEIQLRVNEIWGIRLEPEPVFVGF